MLIHVEDVLRDERLSGLHFNSRDDRIYRKYFKPTRILATRCFYRLFSL